MPRQPDYYLILGVAPDASPQEIARAYRSLVRRRHPDSRSDGDQPTGLEDIYDAWAVLRDPARRADYDGATRAPQSAARAGAQPPPAGRPVPVRVRRDDPVRARRNPTPAPQDDPARARRGDPVSHGGDEPAARPSTRRPAQHPGSPTIWVGPTVTLGPRPGPHVRPGAWPDLAPGPDLTARPDPIASPDPVAEPDLIELLRELRRRLL